MSYLSFSGIYNRFTMGCDTMSHLIEIKAPLAADAGQELPWALAPADNFY